MEQSNKIERSDANKGDNAALILPDVNQLRELLQYLDENDKAAWITHDGIIKQFLAANSG